MPLQVACPDCGKKYRFAEERAGETVACKDCGSEIEIPGGRRRGASGGKKRQQQGSGVGAGVMIGGGVGAVVLLGLVAVLMKNGGPPAALPAPPANNAQPVASNPVAPSQNNVAPKTVPHVTTPPGTAPATPTQPHPAQPSPTVPGIATNPAAPKPGANAAIPAPSGPAAASGFNVGKGSKGFKPPKDWKVQVDPAAESFAGEATKKFNIKTTAGFLQDSFVTYPETPSPFVLVGQNMSDNDSREVWNLLTGTKGGVIKGPRISSNNLALSPDGKLFAWLRFESGGGIEVRDIAKKNSLGVLSLDVKKFNPAAIILPSSKRLVAVSNVDRSVLSWKLPSGDLEQQITLGDKGQPDSRRAFSPGGRYLAVVGDYLKKSIEIYDLDAGERAGTIEFVDDSVTTDLMGMAFSHDGKEFALAYGQSYTKTAERIVIRNVSDGSIVSDFELPDPDQRNHDKLTSKTSLQWFPDGKRLLLSGAYVIDRDSQSVVFAFPKTSFDFATSRTRRVVTDTIVAAWEGTNKSATISPMEVKADDIARAKEVAAAGGLMFDAKLPKLTAFDREQAADRSRIGGEWKAAADPGPSGAKLADSIPLKSGDGRVRELHCSRPDVGLVCVRISDEEDESKAGISGLVPQSHYIHGAGRSRTRTRIPPVPCRKNWLELYDAIKRAPAGRIDIDFPCELLAVSPDGTRVLVQAIGGEGRLDVFAADGSHVAGCRPYQDDPETKNREIASAAFLDANTVAACSIDDHLIVFRLPSCEPIFAVADAGVLAVSTGGKLIATCGEKKVELRDAVTGEGRGLVSCEGDVQAMSFSPKGDRLAVLFNGRKGSGVIVVDLSTGSPTNVPVPQSIAPLVWCGENELILGSPRSGSINSSAKGVNVDHRLTLVDLSRKAVLWSYVYGTADPVAFGKNSFDGRFWMAGTTGKGNSRQITAVELPEPVAKKQFGNKNIEPQAIVKPGSSISLQFDVAEPPSTPGYAKKARTAVESAIQENGLTVKDGQSVKLVVTIATAPATGTMTLQSLGGRGGVKPPDVTVQRRAAVLRIAYESGGSAIWESKHELSNDTFGITILSEGKDAQTVLDENMWKRALSLLEGNLPPSHVFPASAANGFGTSRLTGSGPVPAAR